MLEEDDFKALYSVLQDELLGVGFSDIIMDINHEFADGSYKSKCNLLLEAFSARLSTMDKNLFLRSMIKIKEVVLTDSIPFGAVVYETDLNKVDPVKVYLDDAPDFSALKNKIHRLQMLLVGEIKWTE